MSDQSIVVIVTGQTMRRIHTAGMLVSKLREKGYSALGLSHTYTKHHMTTLDRLHREALLTPFAERHFSEAVASSTNYVVIEMSSEAFIDSDISKFHTHTVIFSDLRSEDPIVAKELTSFLSKEHSQLKDVVQIICNSDTVHKEHEGFARHYAEITSQDGVRLLTFGRNSLATHHIELDSEQLTLSSNKKSVSGHIPHINDYSSLKQEGLFAALTFLFTQELLQESEDFSMRTSPFVEEHSGDPELLIWTEGMQYPDELYDLLHIPKYRNICMGMTNYLRFEPVIEEGITMYDTLLVVAENDTQSELLSEYFLNKEKSSYHSIIFVPDRDEMRTALQRVFRSQNKPIMYLFDRLSTFGNIYQ